jgi:FkbM family methyltransferase
MAMFMVGDSPLPNILVNCDHGVMIINRFDNDINSVGQMVLDHGNNNTVEADVTARALQHIDQPIIFDVGSNIGTYVTWVAKWSKNNNGKVYCFEPQRQIFQMLCGNLAINNIFNVYAYELGLGKEEKYIEIPEIDYFKPSSSFGSVSLDGIDRKKYHNKVGETQRIKITTLDKFMVEHNIPKVDFIKIDAEGLDIDVMEGGMETIKKFMPDLYVEYLNLGSDRKENTSHEGKDNLINYLQRLGYKTQVVAHDIFATIKNI